jgi:hypothetical protein
MHENVGHRLINSGKDSFGGADSGYESPVVDVSDGTLRLGNMSCRRMMPKSYISQKVSRRLIPAFGSIIRYDRSAGVGKMA